MPQQVRKIEPKKEINLEDLSINDLKALVYDRIGIIEQKHNEVKTMQDEIAQINSFIQKKAG